MSLQSYKDNLLGEVRSGHLDPGEEARLRGALQLAEGRLPAARILSLVVQVDKADEPTPEELADPSAEA